MNVEPERQSEPATHRIVFLPDSAYLAANSPLKQGLGLGELELERNNAGDAGVSLSGRPLSGVPSAEVHSIPGLSSGPGLPSGPAPPDAGVCSGHPGDLVHVLAMEEHHWDVEPAAAYDVLSAFPHLLVDISSGR